MKVDWKKEIKLPRLGGRSSAPKEKRASKISRSKPNLAAPTFLSNVKGPKIVTDLYADLRDRRLLPLVALLLVAMVAAPILLGNKSEAEPEVAAIATAPGVQKDAGFEVVPAESGLRDYRRRLGHRDPRDPFAQPGGNAAAAASSAAGETGSNGERSRSSGQTESTSGSSSPEGPAASAESTEAAPAAGPVTPEKGGGEAPGGVNSQHGSNERGSEGSSESGGAGSGGGADPAPRGGGSKKETAPVAPSTSTSTTTVVEKNITGYAIAAKTMLIGKDQKPGAITVKEMGKLPDPKQPVAVYLGVSEDKGGALFLLGNEVTAYYGHGRCTLDKQSCTVLELRPGKSATLAFGIEEKRYKITLDAIEPEVETNEVATTSVEAPPSR